MLNGIGLPRTPMVSLMRRFFENVFECSDEASEGPLHGIVNVNYFSSG